MSDDFHAFRPVPKTGVIYVTTEATQARLLHRPTPTGATSARAARDGRPARRAAARPRRRRSPPTIRSTRPSPASGSCARRSPHSTTGSTARACRRSTPPRTCASPAAGARRSRARRRASGSINLGHFLPDYTAYEELLDIFKAFTPIPILLEGEQRLQLHRRRPAARDPGPRPLGAAPVEPVQPDGQARRGRGARALGAASRASSTARCCSTSSTRTTSTAAVPARCRSRAPRATWRTSTRIRS